MEELCTNCPLRDSTIGYSRAQQIVENTRVQLDKKEDVSAVADLYFGEYALNALAKARPERCNQLDQVLPGARQRHASRNNSLPFISCPEMALADLIIPVEYPENIENL